MALSFKKCARGSRAGPDKCLRILRGRELAPELLSALKWSRRVSVSSAVVILDWASSVRG